MVIMRKQLTSQVEAKPLTLERADAATTLLPFLSNAGLTTDDAANAIK